MPVTCKVFPIQRHKKMLQCHSTQIESSSIKSKFFNYFCQTSFHKTFLFQKQVIGLAFFKLDNKLKDIILPWLIYVFEGETKQFDSS